MWRIAVVLSAALACADDPLPFVAQVEAPRDGTELVCSATLRSPSTSWDLPGRESAVVTVTIDGEYGQDIVVFLDGLDYRFLVGPVSRGKHTLRLERDAAKSPAGDAAVSLARFQVEPSDDPALAYVPMLYGRPGGENGKPLNSYNDVPLLLYMREEKKDDGVTYEYTMIWSDEDGGMGTYPPMLMARYGRTTDIDWVYRVRLDRQGAIREETYQTVGDRSAPFTGRKIGRHPVLVVATANNCMLQVAEGSEPKTGLRCMLVPHSWDGAGARERVMDAHPWTYRVANEEMQRERGPFGAKMEFPGDPHKTTLSDSRDYLMLEMNLEAPGVVRWRISARVGSEWFTSDHGLPLARLGGSESGRVAIKLPAGLPADGVQEVKVEASGLSQGQRARVRSLTALRLDDEFVPRSAGFELGQPADLSAEAPVLHLTPNKR